MKEINQKDIIKLYQEEKKSIRYIEQLYGVNKGIIKGILLENKIPLRDRVENLKGRQLPKKWEDLSFERKHRYHRQFRKETCDVCGSKKGVSTHHEPRFTRENYKTWNGKTYTLCQKCHSRTTNLYRDLCVELAEKNNLVNFSIIEEYKKRYGYI